MFTFYAQITAPQTAADNLLTSLAALTRMSRNQLRVFSADQAWSAWAA